MMYIEYLPFILIGTGLLCYIYIGGVIVSGILGGKKHVKNAVYLSDREKEILNKSALLIVFGAVLFIIVHVYRIFIYK